MENSLESINSLYERYGGMLLGYISGVVQDRKLAEDYLVQLFFDLPQQFNESDWRGSSNWCPLQRFAREKLIDLTKNLKSAETHSRAGLVLYSSESKYLERLTNEQKRISYSVYYYGKTIAAISEEFNKTEDLIRKTSKEAFTIMRKSGEN